MAVRYAALSACRKVHPWRLTVDEKTLPMATITGRTDRRTDRQTDRVRRNMRPLPREEGRITTGTPLMMPVITSGIIIIIIIITTTTTTIIIIIIIVIISSSTDQLPLSSRWQIIKTAAVGSETWLQPVGCSSGLFLYYLDVTTSVVGRSVGRTPTTNTRRRSWRHIQPTSPVSHMHVMAVETDPGDTWLLLRLGLYRTHCCEQMGEFGRDWQKQNKS